MPLRILSWLSKDKRPRAPEARPVAPQPVPPPPLPTPAPKLGTPSLRAYLDREKADQITRLEATLSPADRAGDPGALLDDLGSGIAGSIRRPPMAAQQALAACRDPNASLGQILVNFHQDPSLTQSLLKHANSSYYASGGSVVTSLSDAAQRVGISGLHGLLMGSMVEGLLCRPGGEYGTMVHQVWTHMVRTAPYARRLGRAVGLRPETCYTLGLLHDLGKLIIFDRIAAIRTSVRHTMRLPRPFLAELLGRLHGPLGGVAALEWNLDEESARAIAAHPRDAYRQYQDSWYGEIGFTLEEGDGEAMSQVLAVAEWWDLSGVRGQLRDFDAFWARTALTLPIETCRETLE